MKLRIFYIVYINEQARNQGGKAPLKIFLPLEKCVVYSWKLLGLSQKTLRPSWCPKLVTGL